MLSNSWQTIGHLLLLCADDPDILQSIELIREHLRQALPDTTITVISFSQAIILDQINSSALEASIEELRQLSCDAAILLTAPGQSPYLLAYLCYLAGIPIRIGQSQEFGGGVLSECITPFSDPISLLDYYLHFLNAIGLAVTDQFPFEVYSLSNSSLSQPENSKPSTLASVNQDQLISNLFTNLPQTNS